MDMTPDDLLTAPQTADLLGVSARRVHQLREAGELPADRLGGIWLFWRREVDRLAAERAADPPRPGRPPAAKKSKKNNQVRD